MCDVAELDDTYTDHHEINGDLQAGEISALYGGMQSPALPRVSGDVTRSLTQPSCTSLRLPVSRHENLYRSSPEVIFLSEIQISQ